jgi:hypothetical protein
MYLYVKWNRTGRRWETRVSRPVVETRRPTHRVLQKHTEKEFTMN